MSNPYLIYIYYHIIFMIFFIFFFFNDTATTEIYTLSLHDALPISRGDVTRGDQLRILARKRNGPRARILCLRAAGADRKSTRLNSSHLVISYAVFCLKKKKKEIALSQNVQDLDCSLATVSLSC